jgi:hypothetical protein
LVSASCKTRISAKPTLNGSNPNASAVLLFVGSKSLVEYPMVCKPFLLSCMVPTDTPSALPLHADTPAGQLFDPLLPLLPLADSADNAELVSRTPPLPLALLAPMTPLPSLQAASAQSSAVITPIRNFNHAIATPISRLKNARDGVWPHGSDELRASPK